MSASGGTLMTHAESIKLFKELGVKFTPELKEPGVPMPFDGFTEEAYAQKLIDEYKAAGIDAKDVFPQSFRLKPSATGSRTRRNSASRRSISTSATKSSPASIRTSRRPGNPT